MTAIAPNLTILVGELVGARLIAHAGRNLLSQRLLIKYFYVVIIQNFKGVFIYHETCVVIFRLFGQFGKASFINSPDLGSRKGTFQVRLIMSLS